jgi:hypothetical protein
VYARAKHKKKAHAKTQRRKESAKKSMKNQAIFHGLSFAAWRDHFYNCEAAAT